MMGCFAGSVSDDDVSKPSKGEVDEWSLIQMAGRMEIISIHDISLAKFLGSGGYGEVCCLLELTLVMILMTFCVDHSSLGAMHVSYSQACLWDHQSHDVSRFSWHGAYGPMHYGC